MTAIVKRWRRIVYEEVAMSQLLNKIGLLSPLSSRVSIALSSDGDAVIIPAYLSETFANLGKTRGWFIIDSKAMHCSTWKFGKNFLFKSAEERLDEKNWDPVVDSLLNDIVKICLHNLQFGSDSINMAIVKKPSNLTVCQYEIRFFGFDFSSKRGAISIPEIEEKRSGSPDFEYAQELTERLINKVFWYEFWSEQHTEKEEDQIRKLQDHLSEKYTKAVLVRILTHMGL